MFPRAPRSLVHLFRLFPVLLSVLTVEPSFASQADAIVISRNIQAYHLPWGTVLDPLYASAESRAITAYTRCGDSAIWTGHYLAAEAYRYKVTAAPEALTNIRAAIAGLQGLVDVTGTGLLARCRFPANSPFAQSIIKEEQHNGIHVDASSAYSWVGNTSRDQYLGVFFGLAVAFDVTGDAGVRSSAATLIGRMLDFLVANNWSVVMPDGTQSTTFAIRPDQQLSLLQVGVHMDPNKYLALYQSRTTQILSLVGIPVGLEVQSISSYFKFNLDYIAFFNLIRLENDTQLAGQYRSAYQTLRSYTASHQNAFFDMIDLALNGPNGVRDTEAVTLMNSLLKRTARDFYVDLRGVLPACGSPDEACSPVPVERRPPTDFLWQRDPFQLSGGGQGTIESAGIDYILPFWMARAYSIVDGSAVVSAASGDILAVAPASIAAFYGAGLATGTAQASSLPLPTVLGNGVGVQVTDASGTVSAAPLFYVSPGQINFEVPEGLAPGRAMFSVRNGGSLIASTSANIQAISPGLFAGVFQGGSSPHLVLYGTGIRNGSSSPSPSPSVTATVNGISATVLYAGPQGGEVGLDQINIAIPTNLPASGGRFSAVVMVNGIAANPITVATN